MDSTRKAIRSILTEAADAPLPPYFYLALNFGYGKHSQHERTLEGLMSGQLEGVMGIGGTSIQDMIMDWGHIREMLVRMPSDDVARLNNVSKVRYDDPDYLMADNMAVLARLFNNVGNPQQTLTKMNRHVIDAMKKLGAERYASSFQYTAELQSFGSWFRNSGETINSVDDMVMMFIQYLDAMSKSESYQERDRARRLNYGEEDFPSPEQWKEWFTAGIINMGELYSAEDEWVVQDPTFDVPESSEIWIKGPDPQFLRLYKQYKAGNMNRYSFYGEEDYEALDEWYESIEVLRTKYPLVKIVPFQAIEKERTKLFSRRQKLSKAGD